MFQFFKEANFQANFDELLINFNTYISKFTYYS